MTKTKTKVFIMLNTFSLGEDVIKPAIFWLCRLIAGVRLRVKKFFPQQTKMVLLAGTSEVTVFDLLDADEIITELGKKQSSMLVSSGTRKFAQTKLLEYEVKIPLISLPQALCVPWDIIIFADHNNTRWFHPDIPKILYGHGLTSGKSHGPGGSWAYGQNALDRKGKPFYEVMFIESSYYQAITLRENPVLNGRLVVIGSVMADKLIALEQKRDTVRQDLGIQPDERVFIVFSTWGPCSLIQRFGLALLDQISEIAGDYKIYFIIHPLNDREEFPHKNVIWESLAEFKRKGIAERVNPSQSWFPYLAAADVVLTDHTSLLLYYTLLEKPIFFVPLEAQALTPESLIWKFYKLQGLYNPNKALAVQLETVIQEFPAQEHRNLVMLQLDERGKARERIQIEIAKFW
jgi:hypothetical protein